MKKDKLNTGTTLAEIRRYAADTIIGLQNGTVTPAVADGIYKQSLTLVDSYRVELRAIELAINNSEGVDFNKAKTVILK